MRGSVATDYYAVLGVRTDATSEEIKRAYRKLARQLHPDVNPEPDAKERFAEVKAAYEVLSDPAKREIVDLGGDPLAQPGMGGAAGQPFTMGFEDLFGAVFGQRTARGPRPRMRPGSDALIRLDLGIEQTAFGVEQELTIDTAITCTTCRGAGTAVGTLPSTCDICCAGRGEVQTVQRSFLGQMMMTPPVRELPGLRHRHPASVWRVRRRRPGAYPPVADREGRPAGVGDGMRIRLSGEGEVGPGGGPAGDLYIEIHERQHDIFTRDGDDLHCRVAVPMTAAALGTDMTVQTLDGEETVEVKPGTQSGTVVRLRARGVPHLRSAGRGDLHIHLEVRTPVRLDAEQERLMRELAKLRDEEHPEPIRPSSSGGFFSKLFNGR
ncbi:DnaJ C-terminal domain-containing protein [Fodinicola feengrottensis]|uniref:DnaJ C-terminal domain-containing protein n=1 Tax=Fodinicola feengrottensis TaxID=435914 RepID=UPI002441CB5B|nr:DnaJ C-terminal domain-containing protein [Fodinicola feengrottensis]